MHKGGYVYIIASKTKVIYIGVTSNLEQRMYRHRHRIGSEFAAKYNCTQLVYYETFGDIRDAIEREKQLKRWRREKKVALIEAANPDWHDLSEKWEN